MFLLNSGSIILSKETFGKPIVHPSEKLMLTLHESLPSIEKRLGYCFQDRSILIQAFVHRSFLNECQLSNLIANERLEFLGDAVLNLYVSAFLFARFPDRGEGPLSKQKAEAVCQTSCAVMMDHLALIANLFDR